MEPLSLTLIALAALLVFWAVGAHNRLVRLSNAVAAEHAPIDAHLRERQQVLATWQALTPALAQPERAALTQALEAQAQAIDALARRPSSARDMARLIEACQQLERHRLALCDLPQAREIAQTDPAWSQAELALQALGIRFEALVQAHQDSTSRFNEAVDEFPAWLIARAVGLKRLPDLALAGVAVNCTGSVGPTIGQSDAKPPDRSVRI
jgi:LemA protein